MKALLVIACLCIAAPVAAQCRERPRALPWLYAGQVALQAADVVTTRRALQLGAVEVSPSARTRYYVTEHPRQFVLLKVGMAGAAIGTSEILWRHCRPNESVAVMIGADGSMGAVFANNVRVIGTLRWGK